MHRPSRCSHIAMPTHRSVIKCSGTHPQFSCAVEISTLSWEPEMARGGWEINNQSQLLVRSVVAAYIIYSQRIQSLDSSLFIIYITYIIYKPVHSRLYEEIVWYAAQINKTLLQNNNDKHGS